MHTQRTAAASATTSKTRTLVTVGLMAMAGIGAYGFGIKPSWETELASARLACYDECSEGRQMCKLDAKRVDECDVAFDGCIKICEGGEQPMEEAEADTTVALKKDDEQMEDDAAGTAADVTAACLADCDYAANKCSTYQPASVCQAEAVECRASCGVSEKDSSGTSAQVAVGSLEVVSHSQPDPGILVPQEGRWETLARYQVMASAAEDVSIRRVRLANLSRPSGAVSQFAIVHNGTMLGTAHSLAGGAEVDVDLLAGPIEVRAGTAETFEVRAMLAPYAWDAITRTASGTLRAPEVRVGLAELHPGLMDLEGVGLRSGQAVSVTAGAGGLDGRPFVVRNAVPHIRFASGLSTLLASGERDLYRIHVTAPIRPVAIKKLSFRLTANANGPGGFRLSNFRLYRNGSMVDPRQVRIQTGTGGDIQATSTLAFPARPQTVVVLFANEERIEETGHIYSLRARVTGSIVEGDSLQTELLRSYNVDPYMTAALSLRTVTSSILQTYPLLDRSESYVGTNMNFDNGYPPRGNARSLLPANFIWSDYGALPRHSARPEAAGGSSSDWNNEAYISDIASAHILSR